MGGLIGMLTFQQIHDLVTFDGGSDLVLSTYLNLTPDRQIRRTYRVAFEDLVRQLELTIPGEQRAALAREAERVRQYLGTAPPAGRGVAVFSCTPRRLWEAVSLPVVVGESVHLGRRPYVRPLLDVLDEYERYAVALVDKEKARLFTVYLGEIEEHALVVDPVPGKHDEGGWSQANYQRHHEAHVYWHLKRVADELSALLRRRPFDRLVLAGPEEATSELRRLLPRPLRQRLVATFPAELFASPAEILDRTLAIERDVERKEDAHLVERLIETATARGLAVLGFAATLEAVWTGGVHQLVVADGLEHPGSECPGCARLALDVPSSCPVCREHPLALSDVVERVIERALEEGGTVKSVMGPAADRLRERGEGIGAFLRYAVE